MVEQEIYEFSEMMQNVYAEVHDYFSTHPSTPKYKDLEYKDIQLSLKEDSMLSAMGQYYAYFPTHFFKARHFLEKVISLETLLQWFTHNPRICLLDIGCGAGAASAAFIDMAYKLHQQGKLTSPIYIYCVGVDISRYALALYSRVLRQIKSHLSDGQITLEFSPVLSGLPETSTLRDLLSTKIIEWQQPRISQALVLQMNIVAPLSTMHYQKEGDTKFFDDFDVDIIDNEENFGEQVARRYEQLLREAKIDHINIITIGTNNKDERKYFLGERVHEMSVAIQSIMRQAKHIEQLQEYSEHKIICRNPVGGFFRDKYATDSHPTTFYAAANFITNADFNDDERWHSILSIKNLKLAAARARQNMLRESLHDETEIRLFEYELDMNLSRLSRQLENYRQVTTEDETIYYALPKSKDKQRPKGLTRLEEEILFAAIVQDLSQEYNARYPRSYAYKINQIRGIGNEYLYQYWFVTYKKYIAESRDAAKKYTNTAYVIRTDISKFFEKIIQQRLLEVAADELYRYSERIEWLLKTLLGRDHHQHESGRGLTQGSIGSAFFANVYLSSLDRLFDNWEIDFFRYVDDMVIVVRDSSDVEKVIETLDKELNTLGLSRNIDKTHIHQSVEDFLQITEQNTQLNELHEEGEDLLDFLWMLDEQLRRAFSLAYNSHDDFWWNILAKYQKCLRSISIYIPLETLSRELTQYLFNGNKRNNRLNGRAYLFFPNLPIGDEEESYTEWYEEFSRSNTDFIHRLKIYREKLLNLFFETYNPVNLSDISREERLIMRFTVNRLSILGLETIGTELEYIFMQSPWTLESSYLFEYMAMAKLYNRLDVLLKYYTNDAGSVVDEYMTSMVLRAVRYFPEINEQLWNTLFDYSILPASNAVRIMATETILAKRYSQQIPLMPHQLDRVKIALLNDNSINNRLRKNYMLILAKQIPEEYLERLPDDSMLHTAKSLALNSSSAFDIFENTEPEIIRKEFYSSRNLPNDQSAPS